MRAGFLIPAVLSVLAAVQVVMGAPAATDSPTSRPNILFFFADDWGRDAGIYADPKIPSPSDVVKTPNIDRLAKEGVQFNNAFYDCPQCMPSRASILTGSYFWRTGSHATMPGRDWSEPDPFTNLVKFTDLLPACGYATAKAVKTLDFNPTMPLGGVGFKRYGLEISKGKTPEDRERRRQEVIRLVRGSISKVLKECPKGNPFFFVYGPINTHRPFAAGSGEALWGIKPDALKGKLPPFLPDVPEVRTDYADYLGEVQALDLMVGIFREELEKAGQADNTLIVLSGDNGVPGFPRGKTQLYDFGCRAPLLVRWPGHVRAGRTVEDFVNLKDLAPTFLEAAGVKPPLTMDARSLMPQLLSEKSGVIDPSRDTAIFGRERHTLAREGDLPYPARAIRTKNFLFIRNFKPERYPLGDPRAKGKKLAGPEDELTAASFFDMDAGLTKSWLMDHRKDGPGKSFFELAFGKRPVEELYDLRKDPHQLQNLAAAPEFQAVVKELSARLAKVMQESHDPRLDDGFDKSPYIERGKAGKTAEEPMTE